MHFPDNVTAALKDAIINVFWKKKDVRSLFERCAVPSSLVSVQDWNAYKFNIVSPVVDALNASRNGLGSLRRMFQEALTYTDGKHLLWLPDGEKRRREAERSLEHLRLLVKDHDTTLKTKQEERQARQTDREIQKKGQAFQQKLDDIKTRFIKSYADNNPAQRGYSFEDILYELFCLFDLNPRAPFRRKGEQIDGAFVHDGDDFLLEAKWQSKKVDLADLRDLDGAVSSSLDNTLGLFVSINGFSDDAIAAYPQGSRPKMICMDGQDITFVSEGRIDLCDLLRRKRDIAVQKRRIFVSVVDVLAGKDHL